MFYRFVHHYCFVNDIIRLIFASLKLRTEQVLGFIELSYTQHETFIAVYISM